MHEPITQWAKLFHSRRQMVVWTFNLEKTCIVLQQRFHPRKNLDLVIFDVDLQRNIFGTEIEEIIQTRTGHGKIAGWHDTRFAAAECRLAEKWQAPAPIAQSFFANLDAVRHIIEVQIGVKALPAVGIGLKCDNPFSKFFLRNEDCIESAIRTDVKENLRPVTRDTFT